MITPFQNTGGKTAIARRLGRFRFTVAQQIFYIVQWMEDGPNGVTGAHATLQTVVIQKSPILSDNDLAISPYQPIMGLCVKVPFLTPDCALNLSTAQWTEAGVNGLRGTAQSSWPLEKGYVILLLLQEEERNARVMVHRYL